jgi:hypothetical protein
MKKLSYEALTACQLVGDEEPAEGDAMKLRRPMYPELCTRDFTEAVDRKIDAELEARPTPFDPIFLVTEKAEDDARAMLRNGHTVREATQGAYNMMTGNNNDPESAWYGWAQRCITAYSRKFIETVRKINPARARLLQDPRWRPNWFII